VLHSGGEHSATRRSVPILFASIVMVMCSSASGVVDQCLKVRRSRNSVSAERDVNAASVDVRHMMTSDRAGRILSGSLDAIVVVTRSGAFGFGTEVQRGLFDSLALRPSSRRWI
jgi:hypothetical protein